MSQCYAQKVSVHNGRSWSNHQLREIATKLPNFENGINVSGNLDSDKEGDLYRHYFKIKNYQISSYPEDKAYSNPNTEIVIDLDADTSQIRKECLGKYDLVFSHTVLEHVKNPFQSFQNLEKLLAPNGILITVVPFIYKFHYSGENFGDYWRYTPHGIDFLHKKVGLFTNLIESGPSRGFEKYLISVASRSGNLYKFDFSAEKFEEWNHNLGQDSYKFLIQSLKNKINTSLRSRYQKKK